jgi:hypothetical protein
MELIRLQMSRYLCLVVLAVLFLAAPACFSGQEKSKKLAVKGRLTDLVRTAWLNLGDSENHCDEFDYFPNGGMRIFYCHLLSFLDYSRFQELIGVPVFRAGPHTREHLNLDSSTSFGHYNRDFIIRIRRVMIPGADDEEFRRRTQAIYDTNVRGLARIFYVSYHKLKAHPGFLRNEIKSYEAMMKSGSLDSLYYEKYFYFMNPAFIKRHDDQSYLMDNGFDGGWNGNVVKTAVAFWIRRSIDGSDEEFFKGLLKLMKTYDRSFLDRKK